MFKLPTMELFDGKNDVIMHLKRHIQRMKGAEATKEVPCHCILLFYLSWLQRGLVI